LNQLQISDIKSDSYILQADRFDVTVSWATLLEGSAEPGFGYEVNRILALNSWDYTRDLSVRIIYVPSEEDLMELMWKPPSVRPLAAITNIFLDCWGMSFPVFLAENREFWEYVTQTNFDETHQVLALFPEY
jgi:hypothetical protein